MFILQNVNTVTIVARKKGGLARNRDDPGGTKYI